MASVYLRILVEYKMLRPRVIPCLLLHNKGLYKTVNFKNHRYVGDPINAVKIFNEKESDELIVLDIDCTVSGSEPNFKLIEKLAAECRMPLAYGGGIKNITQAKRIFGLGVEKICLGSVVLDTPEIIKDLADQVGSQSVVVILDYKKKRFGGYDLYTHNAKRKWNIDLFEFASYCEKLGAGEIVLNSIDRDGTGKGYDIELLGKLRKLVDIPITVLGGAGSLDDMKEVVKSFPIVGLAAGSLFVFKGQYRAVLINYPGKLFKDSLHIDSNVPK